MMYLDSFRSQGIKLRGGQSYHIRIVPTLHTTTSDFDNLSEEDRQCRLSLEMPEKSLFRNYSMKSCIYECILKAAVSLTIKCTYTLSTVFSEKQTNCTPWDYPLPQGKDSASLCTSYYNSTKHFNSLQGFNNIMQDSTVSKRCTQECLPNCKEITYDYRMSSIDIEAKKMCQDDATRKVIQSH